MSKSTTDELVDAITKKKQPKQTNDTLQRFKVWVWDTATPYVTLVAVTAVASWKVFELFQGLTKNNDNAKYLAGALFAVLIGTVIGRLVKLIKK